MDVLYNPTIGPNLMSTSFTHTYLGVEPLAPRNKSLRVAPGYSIKGRGILHNVSVHHDNVKMALDFHVFDIQDFDIIIGHPLEKLFIELPTSMDLNIKLRRDTFSIPITQAKNSVAESLPYPQMP